MAAAFDINPFPALMVGTLVDCQLPHVRRSLAVLEDPTVRPPRTCFTSRVDPDRTAEWVASESTEPVAYENPRGAWAALFHWAPDFTRAVEIVLGLEPMYWMPHSKSVVCIPPGAPAGAWLNPSQGSFDRYTLVLSLNAPPNSGRTEYRADPVTTVCRTDWGAVSGHGEYRHSANNSKRTRWVLEVTIVRRDKPFAGQPTVFPVHHYQRWMEKPVDSHTFRDLILADRDRDDLMRPVELGGAIGRGVVAAKDIRKGTYLCTYRGELLTEDEACVRELEYDGTVDKPPHWGCYMVYFADENQGRKTMCVDGQHSEGMAKLFNHSRYRANAALCQVPVHHPDGVRRWHLVLFTVRPVAAGMPLLWDYGSNHAGDPEWMDDWKPRVPVRCTDDGSGDEPVVAVPPHTIVTVRSAH